MRLTATQERIYHILHKNINRIVTKNEIVEHVWKCDPEYITEDNLRVHIYMMRKRNGWSMKIETIAGVGYKLIG